MGQQQEKQHATETEMRDSEVPRLDSTDALAHYVHDLVDRPHEYGTCVYAMSMAAVAAFNYVADQLGVTGFQASCADMDILRRTRRMERFTVVDLSNALYPQYDLHARLQESLDGIKPWLKEEAQRLLDSEKQAAPRVIDHWRKLASAEVSA